jgi:spore germination cell wall hydrolase CwlJ-like protein
MRSKTRQAGAFALAAMLGFTMAGATATGALAQDFLGANSNQAANAAPAASADGVSFVSHEVVQPLPGADDADRSADTLAELVGDMPPQGDLSSDMQCLAGAIYFEARGEPLLGQLAVGRVIINRAESGRFPASYCGVVYQPGQFSFARGGHMPRINTASAAWQNAKAIARIAHDDLWDSPVKDALFFHATGVRPHWGLTKLAQVDHHIFYR